jgi:hypothetical protein
MYVLTNHQIMINLAKKSNATDQSDIKVAFKKLNLINMRKKTLPCKVARLFLLVNSLS